MNHRVTTEPYRTFAVARAWLWRAPLSVLFFLSHCALADPMLPPRGPMRDPPAVVVDAPGAAPPRASSIAVDIAPYNHGNPTPEEQYMLELINRARANPPAEGLRLRSTTDADILSAYSFFRVDLAQLVTDFSGYVVRPPLAFNPNLIASARGHTQDMAANDFQGHVGSNGSTLTSRIDDAGYKNWNALAENVFAFAKTVFYGHAGFNVDWGVPDLGHRLNIMNFAAGNPVYTEIGIGIVAVTSPGKSVGPRVITEDFGLRFGGQRFVVGVVYRDDDHDGFYSVGEGIGGVLVSTSEGNYAYTSDSGGYAIPIGSSSGSIDVRAEGVGLGAAQQRAVALAGNNVKADFVASAPVLNFEGLWWNSPAESESGWGLNVAHQGDAIFASWFTYDETGNAWWLTMTADRITDKVFRGTLFQSSGPAFNAVPFDPNQVTRTAVGMGTLSFTDEHSGTFAYTVNGITQTKAIVPQQFDAPSACVWNAQQDLATAANYQDLWWAAPANSESGWGLNLVQQGKTIFATWFTYDANRNPVWYSMTAPQTSPGAFGGTLFRTSGPPFNAMPFNRDLVQRVPVGAATLRFADGNNGNFTYRLDDGSNVASQTKAITRQVFRAPGTVCH